MARYLAGREQQKGEFAWAHHGGEGPVVEGLALRMGGRSVVMRLLANTGANEETEQGQEVDPNWKHHGPLLVTHLVQ